MAKGQGMQHGASDVNAFLEKPFLPRWDKGKGMPDPPPESSAYSPAWAVHKLQQNTHTLTPGS